MVRPSAVLIGVGFSAVACGSDGATDPCTASACNITDASCQRAIFSATACEREQSGAAMPKVRTITVDQFQKELDADRAEPTENDATWTTALQLVGLLPSGQSIGDAQTNTAASDVAAYYDPRKKRVTVIDRGSSDEQEDLFELSHEFVHSLQDAEVGLQGFQKEWVTSTESSVAIHSLVEGEATILGADVLARSVGKTRRETDWSSFENTLESSIFRSIDGAATPFFTAAESLPYSIGTRGLVDPWLRLGQAGIDAFYESPRLSLIDWIGNQPLGASEVEPISCYPTAPPPGYAAVDHDTLGIAGILAIYLVGHASLPAFSDSRTAVAFQAAVGWRNDTIITFAPQDPSDPGRAVAWRIHWESAYGIPTLTGAAQSAIPGAAIALDGNDVIIRVASDPAVLMQWDGTPCGTAADLPTAPAAANDAPMMSRIRHVPWHRRVPVPR